MKIIINLILIILFSLHFSCKPKSQETQNTTATNNAAVKKEKPFANVQFASLKDSSCGMPISAGLEDTVNLKGKIYGFCSKECKDAFVNKLVAQKKR